MLRLVFAAALLFATPADNLDEPSPVHGGPPPSCEFSPCTIIFSPGGVVKDYVAKAMDISVRKVQVRIDGACYSACTVLADIARPNVCLTQRAELFIHKGTIPATGERVNIAYTRLLNLWIEARGGQPTKGFLRMSYTQARKFWNKCPSLG